MKVGLIFFGFFLATLAWANSDESIDLGGPATIAELMPTKLDPREAFYRTQAVLEHFGVPIEANDPDFLADMGEHFVGNDLLRRLSFFDPSQSFARYFSLENSLLQVFQDFDSRSVRDFGYDLGASDASPSLRDRILRAQKNPTGHELDGLRIALDPGHMGNDLWDNLTGKYASDGKNKVSEGLINLEVCLLLKQKLEDLGATVLITHSLPLPVATVDYRSYDLRSVAQLELRYQSSEPWFQALLGTAPAGPTLFGAFENSPQVKKLFSEAMRSDLFIKRVDLEARAQMMSEFGPDITLYVHHDTSGNGKVSNKSPNMTRLYVPGDFLATELSDRVSRRAFARHWLDKEAWELSLALGRSTLKQITGQMGIPPAKQDGLGIPLEDGIIARNLYVPRRMRHTITSYHELYFYDRPQEFARLRTFKYSMRIGDKDFPYSDRIRQSADALSAGIVDFVRNLK